ncbi:MAG: TolC family protein [Flavobacteriaceae bacterium]|nr:TolC family protein [Flavobacteriaceae bacterium]
MEKIKNKNSDLMKMIKFDFTLSFTLLLAMLFWSSLSNAQTNKIDEVLSFQEYLGFVKKHHPIVRQAELQLSAGEANLLKARGGFDPKIEIDYDQKRFKNQEYYELLNTTFKIPTWYGVELKAGFEQNDGVFLNPENNVPEIGLYSAGISMALGQGLFINQRMASLQQAKIFKTISLSERNLMVNQIIYEASLAYFNWYQSFQELTVFQNFLSNAQLRFEGIKKLALAGEIAAIDTLEANILLQNRKLNFEQANIQFIKNALSLSNFLWIENSIPLEIQSNIIPDDTLPESIDQILNTSSNLPIDFSIENHPKLLGLNAKIESLKVDQRLKADKLKPEIAFNYQFLATKANRFDSYFEGDYKAGLSFRLPIFLRKERGDLKLSKIKVEESTYAYNYQTLTLKNKIEATLKTINSFESQLKMMNAIVRDYQKLLTAEERKFAMGESSVFLLNNREKSLIDSQLKQIETYNKFFTLKAELFNVLGSDLSIISID